MDTPEMQRARYWARKYGLKIRKVGNGYFLLDKNFCIADQIFLQPQSFLAVKNFLVKQDIKQLTEGLVTNE